MRKRRSKAQAENIPAPILKAVIESLDQEDRGVTHYEGKKIFVDGALPGE
jgi:23S rRNA (uracil1939-C5)-methyltransferase